MSSRDRRAGARATSAHSPLIGRTPWSVMEAGTSSPFTNLRKNSVDHAEFSSKESGKAALEGLLR
eukprot:5100074-Alexandrium_andersonii.AAC.1